MYGECVPPKDLFSSYGLVVARGMSAKQAQNLELKSHLLEGLVERELLLRDAKRLGLGISRDALAADLRRGRARLSLPASQALELGYRLGLGPDMVQALPVQSAKTQAFDQQIYERVIRNVARRTPKDFRLFQEKEAVAARMRDSIRSRVRMSEKEAFAVYELENTKAVARNSLVQQAWFGRFGTKLSSEAVSSWASGNGDAIKKEWETAKSQYGAGCALVSEILLSTGATDDDKASQRTSIDQIKTDLKNGSSFAALAQRLSDGPGALAAGHMGCLSEAYGPGHVELSSAIKDLAEGGVSDVVETTRGFHLVKLHARLTKDNAEQHGRAAVTDRLAAQGLAKGAAETFAKQLITLAVGGEGLDPATKRLRREFLGLPAEATDDEKLNAHQEKALASEDRPRVEISSEFNSTGRPVSNTLPGSSPAKNVLALANDDAVHPEPIGTRSGFVVLQLKSKSVAATAEFEKNKSQHINRLLFAKRADALKSYMSRLRKAAENKISINAAYADKTPAPSDDS